MIVNNIVKDIEKKTGLDSSLIRAYVEDWAMPLMSRGIIVRLVIKRWRGRVRLSPTEIGLDTKISKWDEFMDNYISTGTKLLFPKRINQKFNNIENSARRNLSNYCFETIWGPFIPCTVFKDWREQNEKIKKEYLDFAEEVFNNWENIKKEIEDEYLKFAEMMYIKLNIKSDFETYKKYFFINLNKSILSKEEYKKSVIFKDFFYFIPMPSEAEFDKMELEKISADRRIIQDEMNMREEINKNTLQKKEQHIDQFLEATVGRIREIVTEIVDEVTHGININKSYAKSSSAKKKLIFMIEKIRSLDFYNDEEIRDALDQLQIDLEKKPKDKSEDEIIKSINNLGIIAKNNLFGIISGKSKLLEL